MQPGTKQTGMNTQRADRGKTASANVCRSHLGTTDPHSSISPCGVYMSHWAAANTPLSGRVDLQWPLRICLFISSAATSAVSSVFAGELKRSHSGALSAWTVTTDVQPWEMYSANAHQVHLKLKGLTGAPIKVGLILFLLIRETKGKTFTVLTFRTRSTSRLRTDPSALYSEQSIHFKLFFCFFCDDNI